MGKVWPKGPRSHEERLSQRNPNFPKKSYDIYKRERKRGITEIKYKRNITFFEAKKIVESYMRVNSYVSVALMANPINNKNQQDNYRALVEKKTNLIRTK